MKKSIIATIMAMVMLFSVCAAYAEVQEIGEVNTVKGDLAVFCDVLDNYTYIELSLNDPETGKKDPDGELLIEAKANDDNRPTFYIDIIPTEEFADVASLNDMRLEDFVPFRCSYFMYEGAYYSESVRNDGVIYLKSIDEEMGSATVGTIIRGCMIFVTADTTDDYPALNDYDVVAAEEILDSIVLTVLQPREDILNPISIHYPDPDEN